MTKDDIISALKQVRDPEVPVDIWELGLVYEINIDGANVVLTMTMTSPTCPSCEEIMEMAKNAVAAVPGVKDVKINLVWEPAWDLSRMSDEARVELDLFETGW